MEPVVPNHFRSLTPIGLLLFLDRVILQVRSAALEPSPHQTLRARSAARLRRIYTEFIHRPAYVLWAVSRGLAYCFADDPEPHQVAFWVASALTQVERE